jgi:hypothetical protein
MVRKQLQSRTSKSGYFIGGRYTEETDQPPQLSPAQLQQQQQTYLTRVEQFYSQVKEWRKPDFKIIENEKVNVRDHTGEYDVPVLTIFKTGLPEPDVLVADLLPKGTAVFMAEGLIKLIGESSEEWIMYFLKKNIPTVTDRAGQTRSMYKGVQQDGWYWIDGHRSRAHLMEDQLLLDLLSVVSGYEF